MPLTDEQLAMSAMNGNQEAFTDLVTAHQGKVYGLALHLLRNQQDAADAAQEAFMRCFMSLQSFDTSRSFGAWLYRIAYNHCLDVLRQRKRTPLVASSRHDDDQEVPEAPDLGPGVEELVERVESVETVKQAMNRLSAEHSHILALRYTLDLSYAEIAGVVGAPESTVTMRLYHAKRALRTVLRDLGESSYASS